MVGLEMLSVQKILFKADKSHFASGIEYNGNSVWVFVRETSLVYLIKHFINFCVVAISKLEAVNYSPKSVETFSVNSSEFCLWLLKD